MATLSGPASVAYFVVERFSYPNEEVVYRTLVPEARHRFKSLLRLRHRPKGFCGSIGSQDNDL